MPTDKTDKSEHELLEEWIPKIESMKKQAEENLYECESKNDLLDCFDSLINDFEGRKREIERIF